MRFIKAICMGMGVALAFVSHFVNAQCEQDTYRLLIDGPGTDRFHQVLAHANGDIYIAGFSNSYGTGYDLLLARFTPAGSLVWAKRYDVLGDDGGQSMYMATGPSGVLYIGASLNGIGTDQEDGSLLKIDADGDLLWARQVLPMPFYCQVRAIAERPDGDIIAVGSANSLGAGNNDSWAGRFTAGGALVWLNTYGWSGQDHFTHVELLPDGSFTACSQSMGPTATNRKGYVAHIGADGTPLVCHLHNGGINDTYNHGVANPDGTFLYVGYTESYGAGSRDVLAVLTDAIGNRLWSRTYGTASSEEGLNAVLDPSGGWRIAAFQGPERVAHVLHVFANGDLGEVRQLPDLVLSTSASWAQVLELADDGGYYFAGNDALSPTGVAVVEKLDACAESSCPSVLSSWSVASPVIPQLTPSLPISASSTNVVPITVVTVEITSELLQDFDMIDCDTCSIMGSQADLSICLGDPLFIEPVIDALDPAVLSWAWSMGDGTLSSAAGGVSHTYSSPGAYVVELLVSDTAFGCSDTITFAVSVGDTPSPDLGADVMLCPGDAVLLDPGDPGSSTVLWSNGSSGSSLIVQDPDTIWVVFEQGGCRKADTLLVESPMLPPLLALSDTTICQGGEVFVQAEPGWANWLWSDGSTDGSILIAAAGTFTVQADWNGCMVMDSVSVVIDQVPVFSMGPDQLACEGSTVVLSTGLDGQSHVWSDGSLMESITVTTSGTFWVEVGSVGCSAIDTVTVDLLLPPMIDLGPDQLLCDGGTATLGPVSGGSFTWSTGSNASSLNVAVAGSYAVTVQDQGCTASDTVIISTSESPMVVLPPDTVACGSAVLDLVPVMLLNASSFTWSTGGQANTITVETSGAYWLSATNACGTASDTMLVTLSAALLVELGPDQTLCGEDTITLNSGYASGASLWNDAWSGSSISITGPGLYWLSVSVDGCIGSDSLLVNASPMPAILLPSDTVLCVPDEVPIVLLMVVAEQVNWSTGAVGGEIIADVPGLYIATATNACGAIADSILVTWAEAFSGDSVVPACIGEHVLLSLPSDHTQVLWGDGSMENEITVQNGEYVWAAFDGYGCPRSGQFIVVVDTLDDGSVFVPNVFTPNGDGVNDRFRVVAADAGEFSLTIFNRWGQEIWTADDPSVSWDGTNNGSPVPDGTYIYMLKHRVACAAGDNRRERIGHVTLLR